MPEQTCLRLNLKYPWQHVVLDAVREVERELLPGKIAAAEKAISERLTQEVADPDERLALRGAEIALECVRDSTIEKR
jgi:hypothetical protein